ncbi:WecB/TagA/CpsF family glycosyltransferase [Geodermatophilus sabuli]|uniref:N-acetylglucosaminyldiphosphoundecaprenol N-acetyl-beta-D-mannosaminyltransferase n=1 Tax=Geodermatophilus sabuli TaxID=1564158 RepID=A0A285EGE9_9ACTN|nr:WecB/TagA/CpsF family glycosyltransferase [Geodermatophilus sabuli]MBB3083217.1 N-acetylglucosaminyldiphosphoundecaprenol N-acetyl-beta-D-mannosaminyltransferase [Geodermatophilus sabuli]SNX98212.1 N-acetylglucosaminyldiphosphoundecaprenol N-acetyl-beta-D-mannosaminyltransferase [Geodermatophilus sabuli]
MLTSTPATRVAGFWRSCTQGHRLVASLEDVFAAPWRTQPVRVQTVNLQHVHLIATSQPAAEAVMAADLVSADGWPLAYLARRTGRTCARVTGRDIVDALLRDRSFAGRRVALLGTRSDVAVRFARRLARNDVTLAYGHHGDARTWDVAAIAREVSERDCDVVLVSLGAPRGEPVGQALAELLPRGLIVGVGGAVEMATNDMPAAPAWVGRLGFEWAYRLVHEPRRMGRRYLVESPRALLLLTLALRTNA